MTSDLVGSGLPLLLPKGATVRRLLEEYMLKQERDAGYQHVYTPDLGKVELYKISGHWDHYRDSMYPPMAARARGAGADADELPAPHPDLPERPAQLPRAADPHR